MTTTPTQKPGTERSRLDPEPVARRDLLGLSAVLAAGGALLFGLLGMLRLPKAAVLPTPSRKFRVALPDSLVEGEAFVPPGRSVAVFRDSDGIYAISRVCTHLGCTLKPVPEGFDCPCHGSRFGLDGTVLKGPAPKALPWQAVTRASGGSVIIDEGTEVAPGTKV